MRGGDAGEGDGQRGGEHAGDGGTDDRPPADRGVRVGSDGVQHRVRMADDHPSSAGTSTGTSAGTAAAGTSVGAAAAGTTTCVVRSQCAKCSAGIGRATR